MKTIHKFEIGEGSGVPYAVTMPKGATIITVAALDDTMYIWAVVDTKQPMDIRKIYVTGAGWDLENNILNSNYIGTVHLPPFVWHVFDGGSHAT